MTDRNELREQCEKPWEEIMTFDMPATEENGRALHDKQISILDAFAWEQRIKGMEAAKNIINNLYMSEWEKSPEETLGDGSCGTLKHVFNLIGAEIKKLKEGK